MCVHTLTPRENRVRNIFEQFGKNTIFNEHPANDHLFFDMPDSYRESEYHAVGSEVIDEMVEWWWCRALLNFLQNYRCCPRIESTKCSLFHLLKGNPPYKEGHQIFSNFPIGKLIGSETAV